MSRQGMFSKVREAVLVSHESGYALVEVVNNETVGLCYHRSTPESRAQAQALLVIQAGPNGGPGPSEWELYGNRHIDNALQETLNTFKATHVWFNMARGEWASGQGKPKGNVKAWKLVVTIRITPEGIRAVGTILQP